VNPARFWHLNSPNALIQFFESLHSISLTPTMRSLLPVLALLAPALAAPAAPQWEFTLRVQTGITALEAIVVSPTLVVMFDRTSNDPLQVNNHSAWGELWDLETMTGRALNVVTNSFCASGALLSNGSMVSVGGDPTIPPFPGNPVPDTGNQGIRIFEPCASPAGDGCELFEDPATLHLAARRWYVSAIRIFDGSLLIVGGSHVNENFYNIDPENTFEFFPPKDNGVPRASPFLERSLPANLFPR
jgi:hypothetical protein